MSVSSTTCGVGEGSFFRVGVGGKRMRVWAVGSGSIRRSVMLDLRDMPIDQSERSAGL